MSEADQVRLEHMLEAAYEIVEFTTGETRNSLDTDRKLMRAVSMSIAIVGESAAHLSEELRRNNPQIPWHLIVGMRNFVMHEYFRLELDILWETATESIPALIAELEKILTPESNDDN